MHKSGLLTSEYPRSNPMIVKAILTISQGNGGSDIVGLLKLSNQSVANLSSETKNDFQANFPQDWPEIQVYVFSAFLSIPCLGC